MSFPDSMFLFEIVVEELKSFTDCKEFYIKSKFADVFKLTLRDPNCTDPVPQKRLKKRSQVRDENPSDQKPPVEGKVQSGQSVLFTTPIIKLITTMKNYPIEVTLYSKEDHKKRIGSVHVPWSPVYIDYLYLLATKAIAAPIVVSGSHNVYDDNTSRCVATISLNIKLTHLRDKLISYNRTYAVPNQNTRKHHNTISKSKPDNAAALELLRDPGTIRTVYSGGKTKKKTSNKCKTKKNKPLFVITKDSINTIDKDATKNDAIYEKVEIDPSVPAIQTQIENKCEKMKMKQITLYLVKSDTGLDKKMQDDIVRSKSCLVINRKKFNFLNYMFSHTDKPLGNRVYCVSYFTVENKLNPGSSSKGTSSPGTPSKGSGSTDREGNEIRRPYIVCDEDCLDRKDDGSCQNKPCNVDAKRISVKQCDKVKCNILEKRKLPLPVDDTVILDLASLKQNRLDDLDQAIEKVVGGMSAKMKYDEKTCFCECECTFGFVKRTTYCAVCGGFERPGEDMPRSNQLFPCPAYHKNINKKKSTSGSDRSKMGDSKTSNKKGNKSPTSGKSSPGKTPVGGAPTVDVESDKEYCRKKKREKNDERFKFNYGYTGIPPQIGHSGCAMPCSGTLDPVPKTMGWLWTAEDVPGMKFRPSWRPGCVHKQVLHLLRLAKDPGIVAKKKRKIEKVKKPVKRPLLTVAKKDGEYTVTMETMKSYSKPRTLNQQPFEDKPLLTYTIGRTQEENRIRQKRKERKIRRLQRDQRGFIQSAFEDMCKDICLKIYQQALGFLPISENPDCPCYPKLPEPEDANLDRSCSCSEDDVSIGSETDSDEWLVEFTPPIAHFDPTYKGKKIMKQDRESQYSYLDFRVKLLDRFGNQVVRFFKDLDGKTQCSDLGGFWGPDHQWLEINTDGFIGPDDRWVPLMFIGPHGDQVVCENGKIQDIDGTWLTVGVEGYVDATGKWKYYPRSKSVAPKKIVKKATPGKKEEKATAYKASETLWSCFGDANPKQLSKLGILGHGHDKKLLLQRLTEMLKHGEDVTIPVPYMVPRGPTTTRRGKRDFQTYESSFYLDRSKCKHPAPSDKGIVAVDGYGNKTYFRIKDYINKRPTERLAHLTNQGISTSSFHVPCLSSFVNAKMMRKQQYERFMKNQPSKYMETEYGTSTRNRDVATQAQYRYRYAV